MNRDSSLIPKPPIFSFKEILWFLDRNYDDCLFKVGESEVTRLITYDGYQTLISIQEDKHQLQIKRLSGDDMPFNMLEDYVFRWFDLKRDFNPFYNLLKKSVLSYMVHDYHGLRMVGIPDLFEALCWCIIGQQINLTFAYKIKRRFVEAYGNMMDYAGTSFYTFPSPEILESVTIGDLKEMQFSRQKADYILNLAKVFQESNDLQQRIHHSDTEHQMEQLLALRGVGEWTANYVLMKSLGKIDSIPYGDAGLYKALENHHVITDRKDRDSIDEFFAQFPGWGSYVTIYLWRSLSNPQDQ